MAIIKSKRRSKLSCTFQRTLYTISQKQQLDLITIIFLLKRFKLTLLVFGLILTIQHLQAILHKYKITALLLIYTHMQKRKKKKYQESFSNLHKKLKTHSLRHRARKSQFISQHICENLATTLSDCCRCLHNCNLQQQFQTNCSYVCVWLFIRKEM